MRLARSFSLYSNKLYVDAIKKIQNTNISEAIPLLEEVKQDPVCYSDLKNYTKVSEYLKGCFIATRDYRKLSSVLEQLAFLNMEKPFQETTYLNLLKDLIKSYIDAGLYEKALFWSENYQNILKKKYYSDNFMNEMNLLRSTVYLLFDRYRESEKIILSLMEKEINENMTGIALNNLAMINVLSKNDDHSETIKRLKEAIYQLELAKHTKTTDVPVVEKDPSNETKAIDVMSEERKIQLDKENLARKGDYRTYKYYQQKAELNLLEKLNEIMNIKKLKLSEVCKYKLLNPQSLVAIGNLADVYKTTEDYNSALIWNKYGLDNSQRYNISLYPRFAYSIYSIYKRINNVNMAENFLLSTMSMAKITKSPYAHVAYYKYADILKEGRRFYELYTFTKAYANKHVDNQNSLYNYDITIHEDIKANDFLDPTAIRSNYLVFDDYNTKIN